MAENILIQAPGFSHRYCSLLIAHCSLLIAHCSLFIDMTIALTEHQPAQTLVKPGITWEQFCAIRNSFADIPGIRASYCQGTLEIVTISKLHETIKCILAALLVEYFLRLDIDVFPSGSYTQSVRGVVEYEADLSYAIATEKEYPDLCVEIVVSSGGTDKLKKYRQVGVKEVWIWKRSKIAVYVLQDGDYTQSDRSVLFPDLDLAVLETCVQLRSLTQAVKQFRQSLDRG